jgi:hypothetical protein
MIHLSQPGTALSKAPVGLKTRINRIKRETHSTSTVVAIIVRNTLPQLLGLHKDKIYILV